MKPNQVHNRRREAGFSGRGSMNHIEPINRDDEYIEPISRDDEYNAAARAAGRVISHLGPDRHGFSLLEVLIGIMIVAIFCIPLFRGFNFAARNNALAYYTQNATTFSQKTVEAVKGMLIEGQAEIEVLRQGLEDLLNEKDGTGSAVVDAETYRVLRGDPAYAQLTASKFDKLFERIVFTRADVSIDESSKLYTMEVVLDPDPERYLPDDYRQNNIRDGILAGDVKGMVIGEADIHKYELDEGILYDLQRAFSSNSSNPAEVPDLPAIYNNLTKRIVVDIRSINGTYHISGSDYEVDCYAIYRATVGGVSQTIRVPIKRLICPVENDTINIYARAYRDTVLKEDVPTEAIPMPHSPIAANEIEINCKNPVLPGDERLKIYLVRGEYPVEATGDSYHFDRVEINGSAAHTYFSQANFATGEYSDDYLSIFSNIKGQLGPNAADRILTDDNRRETIGAAREDLNSYKITVTLTDQDDGTLAAEMSSAKSVT